MSTPRPFRLGGDEYVADRPDGYRQGKCWVCQQEKLVCTGTMLRAPSDDDSTLHAICDDCIARARTPHRRAALRAALDRCPA
ncbi:hypothetical protein [Kitasatospora sp. CB01950]|uniref:hypothetical protein n=1 Tax=Kitasatospora sp. CB01950 TaxID=1703930 RepID=UPI00093C3922|nr:hypothetical protein [Kitasatospora sp. CB01950]OKJ15755.1 hypothetical protein AMK19_05680 [Kitasatospora sp. CB01950]